jgi:uncharacterized protein with NAD-binding domain and iron-sulfur cluster
MVARSRTVQTVAAQLWFNLDLEKLGWGLGPSTLTAFERPLETWIDQTQHLDREAWDAAQSPRCAASLCGALSDAESIPKPGPDGFPQSQQERVLQAVSLWCTVHSANLWPRFVGPRNTVNWDLLVDRQEGSGAERLSAQYIRANINPSDRYVQSVAGSTRSRISPGRTWFKNLFVCGDWTRTGLNVGCTEAAVMSGLQAAAALCGEPLPAELLRDW